MDKLLNREARREIFVDNLVYSCVYLVFSWYIWDSMQNDRFFMLSSAVCILCIVLNSFLRLRNPLGAESIENSCLRLGILIVLWNLQVLYFYLSYSFFVTFILWVVLPGIVLFQSNKHFQDVQLNFIVLLGYYFLMLLCLHIVFFRTIPLSFMTACSATALIFVLWWYPAKTKKILDGKDEEVIEFYFYHESNFYRGMLIGSLLFFASNISLFVHVYFNPLFPLFLAIFGLFIQECTLFLLEQTYGGSKLSEVFS